MPVQRRKIFRVFGGVVCGECCILLWGGEAGNEVEGEDKFGGVQERLYGVLAGEQVGSGAKVAGSGSEYKSGIVEVGGKEGQPSESAKGAVHLIFNARQRKQMKYINKFLSFFLLKFFQIL